MLLSILFKKYFKNNQILVSLYIKINLYINNI